jgi:hypothetical protein
LTAIDPSCPYTLNDIIEFIPKIIQFSKMTKKYLAEKMQSMNINIKSYYEFNALQILCLLSCY